jgi:hypothetical protein
VEEVHGKVEVEQVPEGLAGHRARHHIAADDNLTDVGVGQLFKDCFQGGEVAVDVIECRLWG